MIKRKNLGGSPQERGKAPPPLPLAARLQNPYTRRYLPTGSLQQLAEGWRAPPPKNEKKG